MEPRTTQLNKNSEARRQQRTKIMFVTLLLVLLLLAVAIAFLRRKEFQISDVRVVGAQSLDQNSVRNATIQLMSGNYVGVIPRTNALLFSKTTTERNLENMFPAIDYATASFPERNVLEITVKEKKPTSIWCGMKCYFVDMNGILYAESPIFSDGVYLTYRGGTLSDPEHPIKSRFLDLEMFTYVSELVAQLHEFPIHVLAVTLLDSGDLEITVDQIDSIPVDSNAKIIMLGTANVATAMQSLRLIMQDQGFITALQSKINPLEYIDLRFEGKVYYKFKSKIAEPVASTGN